MTQSLNLATVEKYREEIAHKRMIRCEYVERVPLDVMHALLDKAYPQPKRPWYVRLFARKPDFVIGSSDNPYLLRWWIIPRNPIFNVYLHKIIRSDDDRAKHDHPWINVSILLAGGYREFTPKAIYNRKPGSIVFRLGTSLHRLEVEEGRPAWSLFITGPRYRQWGFACPQGWRHWKDFTAPADKGQIGRGCGEMS